MRDILTAVQDEQPDLQNETNNEEMNPNSLRSNISMIGDQTMTRRLADFKILSDMDQNNILDFLSSLYQNLHAEIDAAEPQEPPSRQEEEGPIETFISLAASVHGMERDLEFRRNRVTNANPTLKPAMYKRIEEIQEKYDKERALIKALLEDDNNSIHQRINNLRAEVNILRENLNELRNQPTTTRQQAARDAQIARSESDLRQRERVLRDLQRSQHNNTQGNANTSSSARPTTGIKQPHLLFGPSGTEGSQEDEDKDEQLPAATVPTYGKGKPKTMAEANFRRAVSSSSSSDDEDGSINIPIMTQAQTASLRNWLFRRRNQDAYRKRMLQRLRDILKMNVLIQKTGFIKRIAAQDPRGNLTDHKELFMKVTKKGATHFCDFCNTYFPSPAALASHRKSNLHALLNGLIEDSGTEWSLRSLQRVAQPTLGTRGYCRVCDRTFEHSNDYINHIHSDYHQTALAAIAANVHSSDISRRQLIQAVERFNDKKTPGIKFVVPETSHLIRKLSRKAKSSENEDTEKPQEDGEEEDESE